MFKPHDHCVFRLPGLSSVSGWCVLIGPVCVTSGCDLVNSRPSVLSPSHHLQQTDSRKRKYQQRPPDTVHGSHRRLHQNDPADPGVDPADGVAGLR